MPTEAWLGWDQLQSLIARTTEVPSHSFSIFILQYFSCEYTNSRYWCLPPLSKMPSRYVRCPLPSFHKGDLRTWMLHVQHAKRTDVRLLSLSFPRFQDRTETRTQTRTQPSRNRILPRTFPKNKLRIMLHRILLQLHSRSSLARSGEKRKVGWAVGQWRTAEPSLPLAASPIHAREKSNTFCLRAIVEAVVWVSPWNRVRNWTFEPPLLVAWF